MKYPVQTTAVLIAMATLATLAACGSNNAGPDDTQGEVVAPNAVNVAGADAGNAFAASEQQMSERMMTAVGINAGDSWARKMIEHHQGAIAMSRIVLAHSPSAEAARMARDTIAKQSEEIGKIESLIQNGTPDPRSAELYRPAMMAMDDAMMAAKGSDVSATFLRKMLAHHQGAVAMSDVALANGVTGALRAQVQKTRSDQLRESEMVKAMLRGEPVHKPGNAVPAASGSPQSPLSKGMPVPGTNTPEHIVHNMDNMATNNI